MLYLNARKMATAIVTMAALAYLPYILAQQSDVPKKYRAPVQKQSLESKLAQKAAFVPHSKTALEQLIEVAKRFHIPMGIEWAEQPDAENMPMPPLGDDATVRDLLTAIIGQSPLHIMTIDNGIVHVASSALVVNPKNILNLRIEYFSIRNEDLYEAEWKLGLDIDMEFHPEKYENGYMGGHGHGVEPNDVFAVRNISFSGKNLTVREILNGIAKANGNALWVARLNPAELTADKPSLQQMCDEDKCMVWTFIALSNSTHKEH